MFITLADIPLDGIAFFVFITKEPGPRKDYSLCSIKQIDEPYLVFICDIKKNHVCSEVVGRPLLCNLLATIYRFSTK